MALLLATAGLRAQLLDEHQQPPPSGLSDESNALGRNSTVQRQIIDELKSLEATCNYKLYVVVERSLIGTTPNVFASGLQQKWLPDGDGLVIIVETDTGSIGFGRKLDSGEGIVNGTENIPDYTLLRIMTESLRASEGIDVKEVYILKLVTEISERIKGYYIEKQSPEAGGRSLRLALATIGLLSLLALGGMLVGWMLGKNGKKEGRTLKFPKTDLPERLGAPYGGGGGGSSYFGR